MSQWGWQPAPTQGIWRVGPLWLRPLSAAAPWLTLGLLMIMLWLITGTVTIAKGTLFDISEHGLTEGEVTPLVAMVMPMAHDTMVFFDDARYSLDDEGSVAAFGEHLASRASRLKATSLLVLLDRRVSAGELSRLAEVSKDNGVVRLLIANRRN